MKSIIAIILSSLLMFSCSSSLAPSGDGAGRDEAGVNENIENDGGSVQAGADTSEPPATNSGTEQGGESTNTASGYNVPTDLSFLNSIQKGHFSDKNPDDPNGCWYPGKTTRDLETGEVTYNWDRAADTLDIVAKYDGIYRGNADEKVVYLTFDCGYEYRNDQYPDGVTNAILDVLKEKNVPGTFFVTGDYLSTDSAIVERMLSEGHIVGNHTMHHYNMTTLTPEKFIEEIDLNNQLLKEKIPTAPDMVFYRPPEGGANEWTLALAQKMGLSTVFWAATVADYNTSAQPDPAATLLADKKMLHNGCVYLLHAVSTTNAQILGDLIDYIHAEGYEIRPLDQFVR